MKCEEAQLKILLADSGELPPLEAAELEPHLSSCADCRQYRANAIGIISCARNNLVADGPSRAALARIRVAAGEHAPGRIVEFRFTAMRILAYAAALAVMLGSWFMVSKTESPASRASHSVMTANAHSEQIGHINTIVAALSKEGYHQDVEEQQGESAKKPDIRELARQLLIMEGLAAEEASDTEVVTPDAELLPTDLPESNSSELLSKECV
jgi:anti-sigma factor RsiW